MFLFFVHPGKELFRRFGIDYEYCVCIPEPESLCAGIVAKGI